VTGGYGNTASGISSSISGGVFNVASGLLATAAGGFQNTAQGDYSFAAGRHAKANHEGAFVWADSDVNDFASTNVNQFLIRANGGVGINTNDPAGATLRVYGGAFSVGVFAGNLAPFGNSGFETNFTFPTTHIWCAENGNQVFSVQAGGAVYGTGAYHNLSDARYKTQVQPFPHALDTILALQGVTFEWDRERWSSYSFPEGRQVGFIAQEVEIVLPELVHTDKEGRKSVAYSNVVPVLVEAVKQQQKQIAAQQTENAELKAILTTLLKRLDQIEKSASK
jgi:hypothetical protein